MKHTRHQVDARGTQHCRTDQLWAPSEQRSQCDASCRMTLQAKPETAQLSSCGVDTGTWPHCHSCAHSYHYGMTSQHRVFIYRRDGERIRLQTCSISDTVTAHLPGQVHSSLMRYSALASMSVMLFSFLKYFPSSCLRYQPHIARCHWQGLQS